LNDYLPILLPLAAFANSLQTKDIRLDDFIAEYFAGIGADLPIAPMLSEALKAGRALILLGGLDKVRDINIRNTVVERVVDFFAFHRREGNKFVLTSRVIGYRAVRPLSKIWWNAPLLISKKRGSMNLLHTGSPYWRDRHREIPPSPPLMPKQTVVNCWMRSSKTPVCGSWLPRLCFSPSLH
jgi:hypothetical protein